MKTILGIVSMALVLALPAAAQDWNSSRYNWANSPHNYANSPLNWRNSPHNYQNSPLRYGNERIVRDPAGRPLGYAVPKSNGGINFFDFQGVRRSYLPGR